ncbi:oxidoreductase [Streptomyces sp. H39-C1]|uniref:oxidoreductase n=1 Tax=Streptomyces sp. H39-C1 TaxID=3004355 RepID=UPI0022B0546C|nr:oxidoreductase [Streptomyces sp. H39-C1]MCZ4101057.1 oxidoreductase [Streptomyces sp. H39-C1]
MPTSAPYLPSGGSPSGNRVWLITGASTGLGRALAEEVIAAGDRLIATARDVTAVKDLAESAPDQVQALPLDVTDPAGIRAAVAAATSTFGQIDVLVNNAGFAYRGALEEISDTEVRAQFDTNVFGLLDVTRAVLPGMRARRSGTIVQISSVGGVTATVGGTAYAGTKFALEGLSEGLAAEVAHLGIRVVIAEPGPFRTDFTGRSVRWASQPIDDYRSVLEPARKQFTAMHGNQPGDPHRAARAIIAATRMDSPPLRLPLGANAVDRIRTTLQQRLKDIDDVEPLGRPADYLD